MIKKFGRSARLQFLLFLLLAIVPRLPLIFRNTAFPLGDSEGMLRAGREFLRSGVYSSSRPPGSFIYDVALALVEKIFGQTGVPFFYYTNLFTAVCTAVSLFVLYKIFSKYLSVRQSLLGVLLFNFWPRELAMGGGTADINFLLMCMLLAFWALIEKRLYLAFALSLCAVSARIQGLSLAFPLGLLILWISYQQKNYRRMVVEALGCLAATLVVFLPMIWQSGLSVFNQPYHIGEFTKTQLVGAFLLRGLNVFGPIGLLVLAWIVLKNRVRVWPFLRTHLGFILASHVVLTLAAIYKAPWETYYFLPLVPLSCFAIIALRASPILRTVFVLSYLLPLVIQVQFKPWKWPPTDVRPGVIECQWRQEWIFWGGG